MSGFGIPTFAASPGYFRTVGASMIAGRDFQDTDRPTAAPIVIVNRRFAETYFPGREPVGQRIRLYEKRESTPGEWLTRAVDRAAPVRLVRRYADEWQSDCRLEAKTADPRMLLAYSCITYPGQSGLPLVIALDREPEPVLIGVNIGRQSSWAGTKLDFTSVARPLDAEISATIEAAAARAAQTMWRRRGSTRPEP